MKPASDPEALRIQSVLGHSYQVLEFEQSTHTAEEAANAIGCVVAQIAKSLIFRGKSSDRPVLVIASGTNRVDDKKVKAIIGEKIGRADLAFIEDRCGFKPGGVSPVGHKETPILVLDQDLQQFDVIWAAAGTANAVFELTPDQLASLTGGAWQDIAKA